MTDRQAGIPGALAPDPLTEEMEIQMGPSHPATHGTLKFNLRLDGETIRACETEIGYLHRGFEKMCEQGTWNQVIPYTDRLNYASPLINNFIFVEAVERLAGITVPARCSWIRTMLSEVSRIADHLTALGMGATELGAITVGFYMNEARERLYNLAAIATGARVTVSYGRVGGLARDLGEQFFEEIGPALEHVKRVMVDCEKLLESNRIFLDRMAGVGELSLERALDLGITGPMLRACGLASDLRRDEPYMVYDELDFDVPVGSKGDNFDRFNVRFEEIFQSIKMVEQCIERMPSGPWRVDDPRLVLPPKEKVYGSIEGLMNQFKLVIEGVRIPEGEVYFAGEGANGELGFFLVSDGSGRPYRVRVRPPCFYSVGALESMVTGAKLSDLVAVFGMVNMIGGECDR